MSQRVESSKDQESLGVPEDASKQGRSIADIDVDVEVTLVDETQVWKLRLMGNMNRVTNTEEVTQLIKVAKPKVVTTAATTATTTRPKDRGVVVQEPSEFRDRQKSYADRKRKPMEFEIGDRVMLKVSPWKGVVRFGKRGKLNPRYVGPFKVLAKVGKVAYRLELPQELSRVHHTFHVSNLKKCYADEPLVMPLEGIHVDDKLQFVEEPVEIMEREIKRLKRSRIPLVKVRWNSRRGPEFTWEREDSFKQKYPQLFTNRASSSTTRFEGVTDWYQIQGYREPVIMSSMTSAVTYTSVYIDSELGRAFWGADNEEFLAEEQPLPHVDSPTAESPIYITESDPEEDPEEYEDDEIEDGLVDYPIDGGNDRDADDGDSSRDDTDGEDEDKEDEDEDKEEEEHLAPADSTMVIPVDEPIPISLPPEAEVERLLAMTTPSPSPPILLSPPSAGECLARIASTQALIDVVTAALPLPPLPPLPSSLYIPPPVDHRDDIPESEQPPRKRLYLSTLGSRYEVGESSTARPTRGQGIDYGFVSTVDAEERRQGIRDVGYGIRDTWVDPTEAVLEITPMTVGEDDSPGDCMDGGGGGLCFPRGLGSLDRIESGDSSGALDPS
ncbi:hypothetical protein Tco_1310295 [Tanacetum coccineum]